MKQCAGIVLCGGESRRMGVPKWALPFGEESLLQRVVRLVGEVCAPVVVVAASEQQLPQLASDILVVRDRQRSRGPLEGLAVGLKALPAEVHEAYVTACDAALLLPAFVERMLSLADERHLVVVPRHGDRDHPLASVYRRELLPTIEAALAENRLRVRDLFEQVPVRRVLSAQWQDIDPNSDSLKNVNTPEEYRAAIEFLGLPIDEASSWKEPGAGASG